MEGRPFYLASPALSLQTMAEMKRRPHHHLNPHLPHTSPPKPPALIPIIHARPAPYKPATPYSIEDILSKPEARTSPSSPPQSPDYPSASPHHSLSPHSYGYSTTTPLWWHGILRSMWKDRITSKFPRLLLYIALIDLAIKHNRFYN